MPTGIRAAVLTPAPSRTTTSFARARQSATLWRGRLRRSDQGERVWQIILDNADDPEVPFPTDATMRLASFLPKCCNGSVLVTARRKNVAALLIGSWGNMFPELVM